MTLRLRCIRCGEWDDMDPCTEVAWGLCRRCWGKHPALGGSGSMQQWRRHQKSWEHHPTFIALTAALEALESTPHGTLDTQLLASTHDNQS